MKKKLKESLAEIEQIANDIEQIDDKSKRVAVSLLILASAAYLDVDDEFHKAITPVANKIMNAAKGVIT